MQMNFLTLKIAIKYFGQNSDMHKKEKKKECKNCAKITQKTPQTLKSEKCTKIEN